MTVAPAGAESKRISTYVLAAVGGVAIGAGSAEAGGGSAMGAVAVTGGAVSTAAIGATGAVGTTGGVAAIFAGVAGVACRAGWPTRLGAFAAVVRPSPSNMRYPAANALTIA